MPALPAGSLSAVDAVRQYVVGKAASLSLSSAISLALAREVLQTMALEKMAMVGFVLLPVSLLTISVGLAVGQGAGGKERVRVGSPAAEKKADTKFAPAAAQPSPPVDPLLQQLLAAARQRFETQCAYYKEGRRITLDRFVTASDRLMEVDLMVARTDKERLAAMERHVSRLKEIEDRVRKDFEVGRGTIADVSEITENRLEAEVMLRNARHARLPSDTSTLEHRLSEVERKLDQLLKQQGKTSPR